MTPQTTFVNGVNPWLVIAAKTKPDVAALPRQLVRLTQEAIIQYLRKNGDSTNSAIAIGLRATTASVGASGKRLLRLGIVEYYQPRRKSYKVCRLVIADASMEPQSLKARRWLWKNPGSSSREMSEAEGMRVDIARALLYALQKKGEATATQVKGVRWAPNRYTLKKEPCPNIQQQSSFIQ